MWLSPSSRNVQPSDLRLVKPAWQLHPKLRRFSECPKSREICWNPAIQQCCSLQFQKCPVRTSTIKYFESFIYDRFVLFKSRILSQPWDFGLLPVILDLYTDLSLLCHPLLETQLLGSELLCLMKMLLKHPTRQKKSMLMTQKERARVSE